MQPENVLPFLQAGRLVWVVVSSQEEGEEQDFGWGAVVDFRAPKKGPVPDAAGTSIEVIMACEKGVEGPARPCPTDDPTKGEMRVVRVALAAIKDISAVRIFLPKDLSSSEQRGQVSRTIGEVVRRFAASGEGVRLLDPVTDMKVIGEGIESLFERRSLLEARLRQSPVLGWPDKEERTMLYARKHELGEKVKLLRKQARAAQAPVMRDTMRRMQRVLKKLGHVNAVTGVIDTKGRVACEVNTADELLVTELVFNGTFIELPEAETAALLSCLVFGERRKDDAGAPKLRESLSAPYRQLQDIARAVAGAFAEAKLEVGFSKAIPIAPSTHSNKSFYCAHQVDPEEYLAALNPDLMEVVFAWCTGAKFIDVMKLTSTYEGTVIRVIKRLEELLRQLASASFVIGNVPLKEKFERCAASLRRDIVFAASLYL